MNSRRTVLLLSLSLNVALAAAVCWLSRTARSSAPETFRPRVVTTRAPRETETGSNQSPATGRSAPFRWSMIESEDYAVYIDNLRAIGCPDSTLRDIIYADVSEMFVRKR